MRKGFTLSTSDKYQIGERVCLTPDLFYHEVSS